MLLQGPVGPFFSELHTALTRQGFPVTRVLFNAGDSLFARRHQCLRFTGSHATWETWLYHEIDRNPPTVIILFGAMRPAHKIARHVAKAIGIPVLSLEEGYLRSGFITCEFAGNNQHSNLCQWSPHWRLAHPGNAPVAIRWAFPIMAVWAAAYYLVRDTFSLPTDDTLFHRERENPFILSMSWTRHMLGRSTARVTESASRNRLVSDPNRDFVLVPLQVPSDSQIQSAARGWSNEALIQATIHALARTKNETVLVFKLHPLDRKGYQHRKIIRHLARAQGVSHYVRVINSGKLGKLTAHASGMIVINSTSAFSAIHQDKPVLVLGDAIYRHQEIVTLGHAAKDIETFLRSRNSRRSDDIQAFMHAVQREALQPGDFYNRHGRRAAVDAIIHKVCQMIRRTDIAMTAAE